MLVLLLAVGGFSFIQHQRVRVAHAQQALLSAQVAALEQSNAESAAAVDRLQADLALRSQLHAQMQARRDQLRELARRATNRIRQVDADCAGQSMPDAVLQQLCQFAGARPNQDRLRAPADGMDAGAGCAAASR